MCVIPARTTHRIHIGPVGFDAVTQTQTIAAIDRLIGERRGGYVVTPNLDHLVEAAREPAFASAQAGASLSLVDGQPLVWMSRLLRAPLPEKVSGSDLLDPLMSYAARAGRRVFFFGSTPDVQREARRRLEARHPGLQVIGGDCSFWRPDDPTPACDSPVVRAIAASGADIVIVALSCPRQELWMARHAAAIAPAIAFGLGASLDFAAGTVRRSPAWMSRAGLEWLFRLAQEPRRLAHRYLVRDMAALPILARALWTSRVRRVRPRVASEARTVQESLT